MKTILIFAPFEANASTRLATLGFVRQRTLDDGAFPEPEGRVEIANPATLLAAMNGQLPKQDYWKRVLPVLWWMPDAIRRDDIKAQGLSSKGQLAEFDYAKMLASTIPWTTILIDDRKESVHKMLLKVLQRYF